MARAPPLAEAHQIGANAATNLEHALAGEAREVHDLREIVELVEAVGVEIVEEGARADRLTRHLEIVDAVIPVVPHGAAEIGSPGPLTHRRSPSGATAVVLTSKASVIALYQILAITS